MRIIVAVAALFVLTPGCGGAGAVDDTESGAAGTADASSGPGTSSGADGSTGAGSTGGAVDCQSDPIDPAMLQWEPLPNLADAAEDNAGMSMVLVDPAGEIYVAGAFATAPDWGS